MPRHMARMAAYVIPVRDGKVFLMRRVNTGWMDGFYNLPAGHVEEDEGPSTAAVREAKEEAGIHIKKENLQFALAMHRLPGGIHDAEYNDYFFTADKWDGEPRICEPDKCDDAQWFPLNNLPENLIPYLRAALDALKDGVKYLER